MKTILITGASSGIGKSTAELFSQNGWNVAATMRNLDNSKQFKNLKNINCYFMDVTDIKSIDKCIEQIIQEYGKIDVILNNAGIYETSPLEEIDIDKIDVVIKTNIYGVINVTKAIIPHFRQNNAGMIVNISSIAGRATFPFQSVYSLTKWAIEGFSEGLRYELKNLNIKVKSIAPGNVKTSLWKNLDENIHKNFHKEYQTNFKNWFSYLNRNIQKGFSPHHEAKFIYKAITQKKDKLRYSTGFNTKLAVFLHKFLPLNTYQSIILKQSKVNS